MGFLTDIRNLFLGDASSAPAADSIPADTKKRTRSGYTAGATNRLNADWKTASVGPNHDLRFALETVRNKARDLVNNDDYAKGYIRQMLVNVVGPFGFSPRISPSVRNKAFRENARAVRDAFFEWCEPENCSVNGEESFLDFQNLVLTYAARDGEFAVRVVRNKRYKFGFALQMLQIELLDEQYNEVLSDDSVVILGIEYDRRTWKRTAYYFRDIPLENQVYGYTSVAGTRRRIPANEVIYDFNKEYENQSRGISWMVQTMNSMRMLSAYDEATLVNARMRAQLGGFIEVDKDAPGTVGAFGDSEDGEGNYIVEIENGSWKALPKGTKAVFSDNEFPSSQYPSFVKENLRRQSVGLGVAGSVHSGDYSDVNYSSEQARQTAIRDNYMLIQEWMIRKFFRRVWNIFIDEAQITGAIRIPFAQEAQYKRVTWSGRRWAYVNPVDAENANVMRWNMRTKSITQMITESDGNLEPEEVIQQIADDIKMCEDAGLTIVAETKNVPGAGAPKKPKPADAEDDDVEEEVVESAKSILSKFSTNGNGVHK